MIISQLAHIPPWLHDQATTILGLLNILIHVILTITLSGRTIIIPISWIKKQRHIEVK